MGSEFAYCQNENRAVPIFLKSHSNSKINIDGWLIVKARISARICNRGAQSFNRPSLARIVSTIYILKLAISRMLPKNFKSIEHKQTILDVRYRDAQRM